MRTLWRHSWQWIWPSSQATNETWQRRPLRIDVTQKTWMATSCKFKARPRSCRTRSLRDLKSLRIHGPSPTKRPTTQSSQTTPKSTLPIKSMNPWSSTLKLLFQKVLLLVWKNLRQRDALIGSLLHRQPMTTPDSQDVPLPARSLSRPSSADLPPKSFINSCWVESVLSAKTSKWNESLNNWSNTTGTKNSTRKKNFSSQAE